MAFECGNGTILTHFLNFQCKACGLAQETRTAFCASISGKIYADSFCADRPPPELTRECTQTKCEYQWFTSQWSKCSVECGKGVQTRNVHCAQLDNDVIKPTTDESKCSGEEKPETSKECDTGKECPGQWFTGPWTDCSKRCGGGEHSRKVLCLVNGEVADAKKCSEDSIAFASEECNKEPCVDDELLPLDTTSKPIEPDDEGEDECGEEPEDGMVILRSAFGEGSPVDKASTENPTESTLFTEELMQSDGTGSTDDSTGTTDGKLWVE